MSETHSLLRLVSLLAKGTRLRYSTTSARPRLDIYPLGGGYLRVFAVAGTLAMTLDNR